ARATRGGAGDCCDYCDFGFMGGPPRPIRLDRYRADCLCRIVSRLDAVRERLDAVDVFSPRAVQRRGHAGDGAATSLVKRNDLVRWRRGQPACNATVEP